MSGSFIAQMVGLRDMTAKLSASFGVPVVRSLVLRRRINRSGVIVTSFVEISPQPVIDLVGPRLASAFQNSSIVLEIDDYQISGISRSYSRSEIVDTGITYFVDGVLSEDKTTLLSGIECDFISILEETLCWRLVLRRKPDQR
jgi:hypothetical protein